MSQSPPAGNGRTKRTLQVELADLPLLLDTLRAGACRAMICGEHEADERLQAYQAMVREMVPPAYDLFEPDAWTAIGMAFEDIIASGGVPAWCVDVEPPARRSWSRDGRMRISVGAMADDAGGTVVLENVRQWLNADYLAKYTGDEPDFEAIREILRELAPMDAVELVGLPEPPAAGASGDELAP